MSFFSSVAAWTGSKSSSPSLSRPGSELKPAVSALGWRRKVLAVFLGGMVVIVFKY